MSNVISYQREVVVKLVEAIVETVAESDPLIGAPAGPMYAALMSTGLSFNSFQSIMQTLLHVGLVKCSNNCYHITEKGREWVAGHSN